MTANDRHEPVFRLLSATSDGVEKAHRPARASGLRDEAAASTIQIVDKGRADPSTYYSISSWRHAVPASRPSAVRSRAPFAAATTV